MGGSESSYCAPVIEQRGSDFNNAIIERCPVLKERYYPPALWGWNAHIHLVLFGALGHGHNLEASGIEDKLVTDLNSDGSTVSFDLFQMRGCDYPIDAPWILIAPGICNNSQSDYVQTFVHYTLRNFPQWRVAVLNHLGTDVRVPMTTPRLFNVGCTESYDQLVQYVRRQWPCAPLISIGFSMGGNIVLKYMGEKPERQRWFRSVVSCCQGYNIDHCVQLVRESYAMRFYSYVITRRYFAMLRRHKDKIFEHWKVASSRSGDDDGKTADDDGDTEDRSLLGLYWKDMHCCNDDSTQCHARAVSHGNVSTGDAVVSEVDETVTFSQTDMQDVDEVFLRRINKFATRKDYYEAMSSSNYLHNITDIPVLLFNADDDPIAPTSCYQFARKQLDVNPKSMFIHTRHGSHMAFYNGGWVIPDKHNVFDQILTQYIDAILHCTALTEGEKEHAGRDHGG